MISAELTSLSIVLFVLIQINLILFRKELFWLSKTTVTNGSSEDRNIKKFFLNDLSTYFNVEPLNQLVYENPEIEAIVSNHNLSQDPSFLKWRKSTVRNSEMYGDYLANENYGTKVLYVRWVSDKVGYGCFANMNIPEFTFLGEYVGVLNYIDEIDDTDYVWTYPLVNNQTTERPLGIDAIHSGNLLRFVNHSKKKRNVRLKYLIRSNQWKLFYVAVKTIMKDEQLFTDYGEKYWKSREIDDPESSFN